MFKKLIASLMTALMAAITFVTPALAATAVNTYPTMLGKTGEFYIVFGDTAASSDVAGATDIAYNLAQLSSRAQTITGGISSIDTGIERKIAIPSTSTGGQLGGSGANNLPAQLRTYHFSGLKQSQIDYKGTKYNYHELVDLKTGSSDTPRMTHTLSDPVNGTLKMKIDLNSIIYKYQFDNAIAFGYTAANTSSYQTPLDLTVAGQSFKIVAIPTTTSFTALVGSVNWISEGETLSAGDLTLTLVAAYSDDKAKVSITDAAGNPVWSGMATTTETSVTFGSDTYKVKVLDSAAPTVAGVSGIAQIIFGKGDVEKTFDGGDTSTLTAWGSKWKIAGQFAAAGNIAASDNITVTYAPSDIVEADKYFAEGGTFAGPANYFELSYVGLYPGSFAKVTIDDVTGKAVYNSTTTTGRQITTTAMNGLEISSNVPGSLVYGATGYDKVYVLFDTASQTGNWSGTKYVLAYWDKTASKIINLTAPTDIQDADFAYTLSYGGPGASTTYSIYGSFSNTNLFTTFKVNGTNDEVTMAWRNRTGATSGNGVELRLGATLSSADTDDVKALVEGTLTDVSSQLRDVLTDGGIQVYTIKDNVVSDKVIVGIPPETVYAKVQFGKLSGATTTTTTSGSTVNVVVPITTPVAKLVSEIKAGQLEKTKNLVLVGGSCRNELVQDLVTAGKLDAGYTCAGGALGAKWVSDTSYIIVVADGFNTGKNVVVVAGTQAADTRVATGLLASYDGTKSTAKFGNDLDTVTTSTATIATATKTAVAA